MPVNWKLDGATTFPFTLGWHPYFLSEDLFNSTLNFDSSQKLVFGERNITTGIESVENKSVFEIKDQQLDDCWMLNSNKIKFNTPRYQLLIESTEEDNFLQLYTPPKSNIIAIEPTTGVSDSFNNEIGLKVLNPDETYNIKWSLNIK